MDCFHRCILVLLSVRIFSFVMTWLLWGLVMASGCVYYQMWKCYDVTILLLHCAIACCLVPLRKDDVIWILFIFARKLFVHKQDRERRVFRQSVRETVNVVAERNYNNDPDSDEEKDVAADQVAEATELANVVAESNQSEPGKDPTDQSEIPERGSVTRKLQYILYRKDTKYYRSPMWQKKLASAIHLGIQFLLLRISLALLIGLFHNATRNFGGTISKWQFAIFLKGLWIHIPLLWFQFIWAFIRQFRLWCELGCARYYLWLLGLVATGCICIELPNHYAMLAMDSSWCALTVSDEDSPICSFFACHLRHTNLTFWKDSDEIDD